MEGYREGGGEGREREGGGRLYIERERERERGWRGREGMEGTNERTNENCFINDGNGISTILFLKFIFYYIQSSGKNKNKNRKQNNYQLKISY